MSRHNPAMSCLTKEHGLSEVDALGEEMEGSPTGRPLFPRAQPVQGSPLSDLPGCSATTALPACHESRAGEAGKSLRAPDPGGKDRRRRRPGRPGFLAPPRIFYAGKAVVVETTGTTDVSSMRYPASLPEERNIVGHPGRCLRDLGFEMGRMKREPPG